MEKQIYIKPEAKYVVFYSEEEITATLDVQTYANGEPGGTVGGGMSGGFELEDPEDGWM